MTARPALVSYQGHYAGSVSRFAAYAIDRAITGLGADGWGKQSLIHVGLGVAFLFEIILTALFIFIVLRVTSATANAAGLHRLLYQEEDISLAAEAQQPGEAATR